MNETTAEIRVKPVGGDAPFPTVSIPRDIAPDDALEIMRAMLDNYGDVRIRRTDETSIAVTFGPLFELIG
jgi:hypothetical protein